MKKEVLILGGGLAGLTAGIELVEQGFKVTILERAPKAGGCAASWTDYRNPQRKVYQYPMHMFFAFAVNLFEIMKRTGTYENLSPWIPGWHFADKDFKVSTLKSGPLTKKIPAPFHSLDIALRFKGIKFLDKISYLPFFLYALILGEEDLNLISDEINYYGLLKLLGLTEGAINWQREITPSITNLPMWKQTGRKFPMLFYLAILRDSDAMKYKLLADDYNPGLIDPMVSYFKRKGGKILFNRLISDIIIENEKVVAVKVINNDGGAEVICPNCGVKLYLRIPEYSCPKCGWKIKTTILSDSAEEIFQANYFISALQPHQLVKVISAHPNHPLRKFQYFRNLWEYKGASLSISRIFLKERIVPLEDNFITGLAREWSHFNGAMDISTLMPRYFGSGSVIDILADHGDTLKAYQISDLKKAILEDVKKLYKVSGALTIKTQLLANIYPPALYHIPTPNMSIYQPKTQQTPIDNLILAGDWIDYQEIGMEGAVRSGKQAASLILKKEGKPELEILKPDKGLLVGLVHNLRDFLRRKR